MTRQAAETYTVLESCTYASKALGNFVDYGHGEENCDCVHREGAFDFHSPDLLADLFLVGKPRESQACGADSKCVNRLMQIECASDGCRCYQHCQNQRSLISVQRRHTSADSSLSQIREEGVRSARHRQNREERVRSENCE